MATRESSPYVRVKNRAAKDAFTGRWAGVVYVIPAGQETLVPWDAMANWFGNPNLIDRLPLHRNRTREFARLRIKYGVYDDMTTWAARVPSVEITTLDGTEKIVPVIHDPDGNHLNPAVESEAERSILRDTVDSMSQQLRVLQAKLDQQGRTDAALAEAGIEHAPKRRGRPPKNPSLDMPGEDVPDRPKAALQ